MKMQRNWSRLTERYLLKEVTLFSMFDHLSYRNRDEFQTEFIKPTSLLVVLWSYRSVTLFLWCLLKCIKFERYKLKVWLSFVWNVAMFVIYTGIKFHMSCSGVSLVITMKWMAIYFRQPYFCCSTCNKKYHTVCSILCWRSCMVLYHVVLLLLPSYRFMWLPCFCYDWWDIKEYELVVAYSHLVVQRYCKRCVYA